MTFGVLAAVAASSSASNDITPGVLGFLVVAVMGVALVFLLWRIRMVAALLLYPFIGWLMFAGALDYQLIAMNPDAAPLAPQGASTDIPL